VGGDTTAARTLTIGITAVGTALPSEIVARKGAAPNQLICVSGDLGGAYVGLMLLEREKRVFAQNNEIQPDLDGNDYILQRQLRPEARTDFKQIFTQLAFLPSAMIDLSDGIASDIQHLCDASGIGCKIYEEKIPLDTQTIQTAQGFNLDVTVCALNGGEDYELLFTVPQVHYEKIKNHPDITIIGYTTDAADGRQLIARDGTAHELKARLAD
jgi:thiamine-monophosphate kinase